MVVAANAAASTTRAIRATPPRPAGAKPTVRRGWRRDVTMCVGGSSGDGAHLARRGDAPTMAPPAQGAHPIGSGWVAVPASRYPVAMTLRFYVAHGASGSAASMAGHVRGL